MANSTQAFFLPAADAGARFCLFHPFQGGVLRGRVVHVQALGEEMNKSRRMAALQARALSAAGFSVLQMDLFGCGDSDGDFGDAAWSDWIADVKLACTWLRARDDAHRQAPLWLWGQRVGCLLAAEAGAQVDETCNYCFWQPVAAGKSALQQWLRLKLAAGMVGGGAKGQMDEMRQQLAQGRAVELGGYLLSPGLASGLEAARLAPPAGGGELAWFELSTRADAQQFSPVSEQTLQQWRQAGYRTQSQLVPGPSFWQTTEIEDAPALIAATTAALLAPASTPSPAEVGVA